MFKLPALCALLIIVSLSARAAELSRITNLSIFTGIDSPGDHFTLGFVVGGAGTSGEKPVVVRAAGPALGALGVGNTVRDPRLELFAGTQRPVENDNWGGAESIANAMAGVGAFAFTDPRSLDAAVLATLPAGGNSVKISAVGSATGAVLAEVYDATPSERYVGSQPRLVNVSVLKQIGTSSALGFVIVGAAPKTVLVRVVGPSLAAAPFNVPSPMANPKLVLFGAGQVRLGENDDWGGTAVLREASQAAGAFALAASSRDAALLTTLPAGEYSVVASGVGGGTGVGLIEVYEIETPLARNETDTFTIAVLPDTQYYSAPHPIQNGSPAMFSAQTEWIRSQRAAENIVYVAHVGDVVEQGDSGGSVSATRQWTNATDAMYRLETPVSIPYGVAVGNHDQTPIGDINGTTNRFNANFGVARFTGRPYYGGHYGTNNNNHYDLFTGAGVDYVAIYTEYDASNARPAHNTWTDEIVGAFPSRKAILVTHNMAAAGANYSALSSQGSRLLAATRARNNVVLALGGHVSGNFNFRRDPSGSYDREKVTTLVANYQFDAMGGAGFMRLYRFAPKHGIMSCRTYSPYLDEYKRDYGNEFVQSLDPRGPAEEGLVVLSDDRLAVAAVLSTVDGHDTPGFSSIGVSFQTTAKNNNWTEWRLLPGQSGFRQAHAVLLPGERLAVFGIGQASDAFVCYQLSAGAEGIWSPWIQIPNTPLQPDGSKALSYIKGLVLPDTRLAAIGWSDGGAVHYAEQTSIGGPFGSWTSLGGSDFRQGDVVRLRDGRIGIVAVGHNTPVQFNLQTGERAWSGWTVIPSGSTLYSYACAVAKPDGGLAVFATRVDNRTQNVQFSELPPNSSTWSTFANAGTGMTGLARVHAVTRSDGRLAVFGSAEHSVTCHALQTSAGGAFGAWQILGPVNAYEIGSVKAAVLSDNSLAVVSHGAGSLEYYAYQPRADADWTPAMGLTPVWTR